ncbi:ATP-binding protein [Xenorhabdus sp. XENO-7]|uniref:ATP-binding protein n=1 Tax=Xenorhabdus aichiensis TaxID=3025874 RepID=A0ABT5M175_9GAMM|nr:ATP-binding protein [Xenorhabdus aichiensis]MDC9621434.1 ATP-binding protein [Xenorhabdus aichiensis]
MISLFSIKNFGPIEACEGERLGKINLFIGENSCGKTYLLKILYCILRTEEETGRGNDRREFFEVLSDKLYWTFQTEKLGEMVRKGSRNRLSIYTRMTNGGELNFKFGPDTTNTIRPDLNSLTGREANSIFLPPKEVLSLWNVIMKSALQDKVFGYDATYSDLVLALQNQTQKGRNFENFKQSRKLLEDMFQGKIVFESDRWVYKKGNARFSIHNTAEGIKKIAILDTLLGNRYLTPDSVIFIDEPESALHPTAIVQLLDIVKLLAQQGIQIFMATHSYYVIKKLLLIAKYESMPIPCFTPDDNGIWRQTCLLKEGLPDNEIINESIRLFEQEFNGIK